MGRTLEDLPTNCAVTHSVSPRADAEARKRSMSVVVVGGRLYMHHMWLSGVQRIVPSRETFAGKR